MLKKINFFPFFIIVFILGMGNVLAEKIIREYTNEGCNESLGSCITIDKPFVIQYDTETKKYDLGVLLNGYNAVHNLEYNGNKYMLGTYFYDGGASTSYSYKLYLNELETPLELKSDESLEIYYCISGEYGAQNYSNGTKYVAIFSDEVLYESYKNTTEKPMDSCYHIKSNEVKDGQEGIENKKECASYSVYYNKIKNYYASYKKSNKANLSDLNNAEAQIEILKGLCSSVTQYANYGTNCLDACLQLQTDIDSLKNQYGINSISNNKICGFSEKLILFIANIIKWVKYIIPVIVIVLGILDFIKAIAAGKEDEMKKAQGRFVKRLIAAALIFIIPFIIEFVLNKMGFDSNGCGIIDL